MGLIELLIFAVVLLVGAVIAALIISGKILLSVSNCIIAGFFKKPKEEPGLQKLEKAASPKALQPVDIDKELAKIDKMEGIEFEHYVAKLLKHQGFQTEVTSGSGDFGVDIVASKPPLKYAVQVKRYSKNVSRGAVSDAVGGKEHYSCNAAMVVTNASFTAKAQELAQSNKCRLVDRAELRKWIISFQQESAST